LAFLPSGQTVTNVDTFAGTVNVDNIVRELIASGKTWKSYAESIPSMGYTGATSIRTRNGIIRLRILPMW
jgi:hypothetical protein